MTQETVPLDRGLPTAPIAVVMISRNEGHNMEAVLANLSGFAQEIFLVDSLSTDETVDIALKHGVHVVQRHFRGFGDQWNFALQHLPISAPWTMKIDPDERLTDELKASIRENLQDGEADGFTLTRRLCFMGKPLNVSQSILRIWRTGTCRFSDVLVNEHPIVEGPVAHLRGHMEHHDSPTLHHWLEKQNAYTTAEAYASWRNDRLSAPPSLFGSPLARRMWLKRHFHYLPFRFLLMSLYCFFFEGAWRAGQVGWIWSRLRGDVYRFRAYKLKEMHIRDAGQGVPPGVRGRPNPRVPLLDHDIAFGAAQVAVPTAVAYHDKMAAGWDHRYTAGGFRRRAEFILADIFPRIPKTGSWLDVGCGTAYFGRRLASKGAQITGIDGSQNMIAWAEKLAEEEELSSRMSFQTVKDMEQLPFVACQFDHALCLSVLEYLPDPDLCLKEIARTIKSGGTLLVSVPNRTSLIRRMQSILHLFSGRGSHLSVAYLDTSLHSWTEGQLTAAAAAHGIVSEAILRFDPFIPLWLWLLFPPSMLFFIGRKM